MSTFFRLLLISTLVIAVSINGCTQGTIREYSQGNPGQVAVRDVSEDEYWKHQVDEHITAELRHEKPEAGYETWRAYYEWWYGVIRKKRKPPWRSTEFKTSEDLVNYIKEKRREKRLPEYE